MWETIKPAVVGLCGSKKAMGLAASWLAALLVMLLGESVGLSLEAATALAQGAVAAGVALATGQGLSDAFGKGKAEATAAMEAAKAGLVFDSESNAWVVKKGEPLDAESAARVLREQAQTALIEAKAAAVRATNPPLSE